ncbi:MAG: 5'/3'-nucleotidase SurE [Eubacteriales bacterium]|nr:5'/3'-nucleotidase SurE [Eubacteriales bacterium]
MHILLVNDDGIQSIGIHALCRAAVQRGHRVSVCAPSTQQSAASHRITLTDPLYVKDFDMGEADVKAWAITGTPTDCVRLALFSLLTEPPDVLISGINDGYNAGMAVHYSGTVGAATEAALNHVYAMAVSVHHEAGQTLYDYVARLAIRTAERYVKLKIPPVTILNMNAPLRDPASMLAPVLAPLSVANFKDSYIRRESPRSGTYYWMTDECLMEPPEAGSDLDWLNKGHVTYTFMGNPSEHGAAFTSFVKDLADAH